MTKVLISKYFQDIDEGCFCCQLGFSNRNGSCITQFLNCILLQQNRKSQKLKLCYESCCGN